MRSIMRRIQRLQTVIPPIPSPKPIPEEDRKYSATLLLLLERMDLAHVRLVVDDLKAEDRSNKGRCRLTVAVFERVYNHLEKNQPLQLPAKVAALEMINEGWTTYNCEDCGYELPSNWPRVSATPPATSMFYFDPCPLCEGKVGWHAFYMKHKLYREQVPLSDEQSVPDATNRDERPNPDLYG